jgi:hypothetical protein
MRTWFYGFSKTGAIWLKDLSHEQQREISHWCADNMPTRAYVVWYNGIEFKKSADYLAFILKFSDELLPNKT